MVLSNLFCPACIKVKWYQTIMGFIVFSGMQIFSLPLASVWTIMLLYGVSSGASCQS